jgi:hypothetical protein
MPQQTKTEALEEIARKMRRDILDGTAPLDGVWWWTDDVKMADRIAHVLLDYSDDEALTIDNLNRQLDEAHAQMVSLIKDPPQISTPYGLLPCDSSGMRRLLDENSKLRETNLNLIGDRNDWRAKALALAPIQPAPVVEEQGPWVVYDKAEKYGLPWSGLFGRWQNLLDDLIPWKSKADAETWVRSVEKDADCTTGWTVITLAEARAIEAAKAGGQ